MQLPRTFKKPSFKQSSNKAKITGDQTVQPMSRLPTYTDQKPNLKTDNLNISLNVNIMITMPEK